ncbi:MAG: chemotaxis protein CheW [Aquisalimonadaceae bacterium]
MGLAAGSPLELLRQLDRLGRDHQAELPSREEHGEQWTGVGFRLGAQHFVSSMGEVSELLKYPELSPVPRTRHWVRGLANVRGNLLPVMDLNSYLGGPITGLTRSSRVLVIDVSGIVTGLLVDEVFGMRQFPEADRSTAVDGVEDYIAPYVSGQFNSDGDRWFLFSMKALVENPQFLQVTG